MAEQNLPGAYENPYKFNAKELDRETNLYYYGARYYNPRLSIWYGVDPLAVYNPVMETQFYGDGQHNGGVGFWGNLNPYIYTYQNPIKYIDPNGKQSFFMNTRNFAPVDSFGGLYGVLDEWQGDGKNRIPTATNQTYRIGGVTSVNLDNNTATFKEMPAARTHNLTEGDTYLSSSILTGKSAIYKKNSLWVYSHNSGNNTGRPGSFDVDTKTSLYYSRKINKDGTIDVNISGKIFGDKFPSMEAYISDKFGNGVLIGSSTPKDDPELGPFLLGGQGNIPMSNIDSTVTLKNNRIIKATNNLTKKTIPIEKTK